MHVCTCLNASIQRSIEETQTRLPSQRPVLCSEFDDCPGAAGRGVRFAVVDLGTASGSRSAPAPSWARPWRAPSQAGVLVPSADGTLDARRVLRWTGVAAALAVAGVLGALTAGRVSGGRSPAPEGSTPAVALAGDERPGTDEPPVQAPAPLAARPASPPLAAEAAMAPAPREQRERPRSRSRSSRDRGSDDEVAPVVIPTGPSIHAVAEGLSRLNAAVAPAPAAPEVDRIAAAGGSPTGASLSAQLQAAAGAAAPAARTATPAAPDPTVMGMLRATTAPETAPGGAPGVTPGAAALPPVLTSAMIAQWLPGIRAQARACVDRFGVPRQLTQVKARVSGATGAVSAVEIVGALAGTATGKCIENAVQRSRLPRFAGDEQVVTAPVVTP
jgi:hypothetical protein